MLMAKKTKLQKFFTNEAVKQAKLDAKYTKKHNKKLKLSDRATKTKKHKPEKFHLAIYYYRICATFYYSRICTCSWLTNQSCWILIR